MNQLHKRILEISYKHNLSHLGSCLTAVDIIDEIFKKKKKDEKFILSNGHAGLALYVVLEKYYGLDAEKIFNHHGVHPDRCVECHIDCSTGSLGNGLPIAVGMALSDRTKNVYCLISDGECSEGSIWESLRAARKEKILGKNLFVHVNWNNWSAYRSTSNDEAYFILKNLYKVVIHDTDMMEYPEFLQGLDAHYHVLTKEEYEST